MKTMIKVFALLILFVLVNAAFSSITIADEEPPGEIQDMQTAESDSNESKIDSTKAETPPEISSKVIAYYFHSTRRCVSCRKLEAYSREAIETGFAEALESGELELLILNTDETEYKHFLDDYQLYTKSLVLSKIEDGEETEWKNLDKAWRLLGNKKGFIKYVQTEVQTFLGQD